MNTCFLFSKNLDENGCLSLTLSPEGAVVELPKVRTFSDIKAIQQQSKTILVESINQASLFDLALTWLPERKARTAIPYALEDKLAQPVEDLHFAFDKLRYVNNHYLVTVISKHRLLYLIKMMEDHQLECEIITLDWFALAPGELIVNELALLIYQEDFKGSLSGDLALTYLKRHESLAIIHFEDSLLPSSPSWTKIAEPSVVWIAKRLLSTNPLNLCQGDMVRKVTANWLVRGYQLAGLLGLIWLLSLLIVNALSLYTLHRHTEEVDQQIAHIYKQFFPQAKQVISPRFRIQQLLTTNNANSDLQFWFLLNQFAKGAKDNKNTIEHLHYQNKTLSVTLVTTDFTALEALEKKLKTLSLKVNQTQASTRDQHVVATLELS